MYAEKIEYTPLVDVDAIPRHLWIDRELGRIKNALHHYYCTGERSHFENKVIFDAHCNIISYKLHKKENDQQVVNELATMLTSKIMMNILDRGFQVHPSAYNGYLRNAVHFALVDHIRAKQHLPYILLFEEPLLVHSGYWSMEDSERSPVENKSRITPEDIVIGQDVDKELIEKFRTIISSTIINGGYQLIYLCYHWYVHRDENLFKKMPERLVNDIKMIVNILELTYPKSVYDYDKYKSEENCYV